MIKKLSIVFLSLFCGILGIAGGWFTGVEKGKNSLLQKEEEHHEDEAALSPKALENMGIIIRPVNLSSFNKYQTILATIEEPATTTQLVFAPIDGHIEKIFVRQNQLVKENDILITLIREAIPRVNLTITQNILQMATEEFHATLSKFRRAVKNLEILEKELERTQKYSQSSTNDKYPIIPQKRLIELQYEVERSKYEETVIREELLRHGLTQEQIERGRLGELPNIDMQIWKKVLEIHGLWSPIANQLYTILPTNIQQLHWTMATIGELVAAGLVTPELIAFLKKKPETRKYFLEIGSLLQQGNTIEKIGHLHELNAFHPIVEIKTFTLEENWDVDTVMVKVHQSVLEGQHLVTLKNYQHLYLVAKPEGSERNFIIQALQKKLVLEAHPLLPGEAPVLENLQIDNILNDETGAMQAYIKVTNKALHLNKDSQGIVKRTWQLRAKQQYIVKIPTQTIENVYVLPKDAIAEDGPNKIVFLQNGDYFKPIEVKVLYQDHENVVIGNNSDIFPGDPIVHKGAFALGLALQSSSKSEAGHGHAH